jgi:anti-sigma-K factor RskA
MSIGQEQSMCELVELYSLDGLPIEEKKAFERHMAGCANCQAAIKELREVVSLLPLASDLEEVPAGMRDRVLGNVLGHKEVKAAEPQNQKEAPVQESAWRRGTGYWRMVSIGLSAAVILLTVYASDLRKELERSEQQLALLHKPAEALRINQMVSLNPAAQEYVSKGLASFVIDEKGTHLIVQAENLPELRKEEAFQVWLIKDNQPVNAGTFYPHNGRGSIYFTLAANQAYDTVAITLEPDAHGEQPRGKPVLAAGLKS